MSFVSRFARKPPAAVVVACCSRSRRRWSALSVVSSRPCGVVVGVASRPSCGGGGCAASLWSVRLVLSRRYPNIAGDPPGQNAPDRGASHVGVALFGVVGRVVCSSCAVVVVLVVVVACRRGWLCCPRGCLLPLVASSLWRCRGDVSSVVCWWWVFGRVVVGSKGVLAALPQHRW